jgi:predicted ATPase
MMSISRLDVNDEMSPPLQCAVTTITQQLSPTEFVEASLIEEKRELKSVERIYGRDEEQKIILQTYHQTIHQKPANPSVLIIQGEEGIGKTFLVEQTLSQRVQLHDHGFFVHWKMHPIVNVPNFMTISSDNGFEDAFASLVHQIMASGESIIQQIQESFQQDIDENDRLTLAEMIPCIAPLLGPIDPSASNSAHVHASGRQLQIFSSLLRILASPTRPLVFFMDNLQYSESCNLRLLEYLLNTNEIQGIFYVLSIGPIQSDDVLQFVRSLHELSATSRTTVTIQLSELDAATTHCMIADMLHVDLETSAPLHTTLYSQIRGNPRRLLSWMNWMYRNQHLEWDRTQDKWHWDSHEILNGIESDLTARTNWNKLPFPIQELLIGMQNYAIFVCGQEFFLIYLQFHLASGILSLHNTWNGSFRSHVIHIYVTQ